MKFDPGYTFDGRIVVKKNTGKTILADRLPFRRDMGEDYRSTDNAGEHRYKIYLDEDGDEYTIIDRFRATNYQVWGRQVSANPNKPSKMVYISG